MANLNETKYPTNIRVVNPTIPVTQNVFQDDVVLECNTTAGAVTLNLLGIPFGSWSTQYKLYVIDATSNASINTITINAGTGIDPNTGLPVAQTINGAASITINTNNGAVLLRIIDNYKYIATYNNSGSAGSAYNTIEDEGVALPQRTIMNFIGAGVTATDFGGKTVINIPGVNLITLNNAALNALITANNIRPGQLYLVGDANYTSGGVIVMGTATNGVSSYGVGLFLNADYQNVGNYSGVVGFTTNVGIWDDAYAGFIVGDVVIYNNRHYKSLTGLTGTAPDTDVVNWSALAPSLTTGYIFECDFVIYDFALAVNAIVHRSDKRKNKVDFSTAGFGNTLLDFQWGRNACNGNVITGASAFNATNCNSTITNNVFESAIFNSSTKHILPGTFNKNIFTSNSIITATSVQGSFSNNTISDSSLVEIPTLNAQGDFSSNHISSSSRITIGVIDNGGSFIKNKITSSTNIQIDNLGAGTDFSENFFASANIDINSIGSSNFIHNTITSRGSFVSATGLSLLNFKRNTIDSEGLVDIAASGANFPLNSIFENCSITNKGSFITPNFGNSGLGITSSMTDCIIRNIGSVVNYINGFYNTINSRICEEGFSNWQETLDFADPLIFAVTTCTIPVWMTPFVGEFTIINVPMGGNITNIVNAPTLHPFIFKPDAIATFTITATAVGVAVAGDIIFNTAAPAYTAVGRVNGCDEFTMKKYGNLIGLRDGGVWV